MILEFFFTYIHIKTLSDKKESIIKGKLRSHTQILAITGFLLEIHEMDGFFNNKILRHRH